MIGKLSGRIDSVQGNQIILDVGGVGYLVSVSNQTLGRLGGAGNAASLLIETHVREDAILLFGFADAAERDAFRFLIAVQGVGAKSALSILGILPPDRLAQAIAAADKAALAKADGVGPKLALRIVTELKDKAPLIGAGALTLPPHGAGSVAAGSPAVMGGGVVDDALSALVNLGYRRMEAYAALSAAMGKEGGEAGLENLIRAALAELMRKDPA